jgi:hypothetical protein
MLVKPGKFKPGDHVFVIAPTNNDLYEGHIMFENVGGYTIKTVRDHSHWPEERVHWSHEPSQSFFARFKLNIIDCSENMIIPYGLSAEVLFTSRGSKVR